MLFRFRVCLDPQLADHAQGWVIASSEISAREILGAGEIQLVQQYGVDIEDFPVGTVLTTHIT